MLRIRNAAIFASIAMLGSAAAQQPIENAEPYEYVLVSLSTDGSREYTSVEIMEAFRGNFENKQSLLQDDKISISGAYEPGDGVVGFYVLHESEPWVAIELMESEPGCESGFLMLSACRMTANVSLESLLQSRRADEDVSNGAQDLESIDRLVPRYYMHARTEYDEQRYQEASKADGVLFVARLHASGEDESDEILLWLDAENEEDARKVAEPLGGNWEFRKWFGSKRIQQILSRG